MIYFSNNFVDNLLLEDIERGDLTTRLLGINNQAKVSFIARNEGLISGVELACKCCEHLGLDTQICISTGQIAKSNEVIFSATGDARAIHQSYKVAQGVLEYSCAVSQKAALMLARAKAANPQAMLLCTRKAPPNMRKIANAAILASGANLHRAGLAESIVVFSHHKVLLDNPKDFISMINKLKAGAMEHKIIIEADNLSEFYEILKAKPDIIQLDKFSLEDAKTAQLAAKECNVQVSAAGAINENNIADYAALGINLLISSAAYYAKPADIKAKIEKFC